MAIKRRYKKKALLLSGLFTAAMFSLSVFSYVSFAWFLGNRTATVNFASMTVNGSGLAASVKYFEKNAKTVSSTTYYDGYDVKALTASTYFNSFTYASDFLDPGASMAPFSMARFNPGYASSYSIEVTNSSSTPKSVGLFLLTYLATSSSANYHVAETVAGHAYAQTDPFNLCEATRVYSAWTVASDPTATGKAFLAKSFVDSASSLTLDDAVGNVFSGHTDGGSSPIALVTPESWMPASPAAIPAGGKGYLFVTFYFSNDSSSYYYLSTATYGDGYAHYAKTSSVSTQSTATSNGYMATAALTPAIAFTSLSLTLIAV
jgi:hypothetical protein